MTWLSLPIPIDLSPNDEKTLISLATSFERNTDPDPSDTRIEGAAGEAATRVLADLDRQGWRVKVDADTNLQICPPNRSSIADDEKSRVQSQELLKRNEQLSQPSVRRFIQRMETPRESAGRFVSIFDLMRDGREFSTSLRKWRSAGTALGEIRSVTDPYVQVVEPHIRDDLTGLRIMDIWRYFRHTWTNQYTTVPGRTMLLLVRDRAVKYHPVIGIAALSSVIVQMNERDRWIGWRTDDVLADLSSRTTSANARWLVEKLERRREEVYVDDLVRDELFWPGMWDRPTREAETALRVEAKTRRADHQRLARSSIQDNLARDNPTFWQHRAETDLYRSKRCLLLADLMRDKSALQEYLYPSPAAGGLRMALQEQKARQAVRAIARRAKADSVGTEIADLSVCGAIAPYRDVIGGKLIAMLAMSPTVIRAYNQKYKRYESEIASSIAGRPIVRPSKLVYIGTTSLYGTTSSQYNRVRIPGSVLDSQTDLRLERLGKSRSFGTSHLSAGSVASLVRLAEQANNGAKVNSIFGEGVNPKLRKVRAGLDALAWPSEALLQHGRQRIIYGVALVNNLREYLLGMDPEPQYRLQVDLTNDVERISAWWVQRWLVGRIQSQKALSRIELNTLDRPVTHGARVQMPFEPDP